MISTTERPLNEAADNEAVDHRAGDSEDGMGMIEIVVSMFMLALLAIAFLPVLIQGLKTSDANARLATATQLVNEGLEQARSFHFGSCDDLEAEWLTPSVVPDGRGAKLTVTHEVVCDETNPDPERVTVSVTPELEPDVELARATTFVTRG